MDTKSACIITAKKQNRKTEGLRIFQQRPAQNRVFSTHLILISRFEHNEVDPETTILELVRVCKAETRVKAEAKETTKRGYCKLLL